MNKNIMLCAICNISSGNCSEDCSFCTQSAHNRIEIETFREKKIEDILYEAKLAKKNGAIGFCLVTAGEGLDDKKLEFVAKSAKAVKKEVDIMLIACNGIASKEHLKELKNAGVESYNHNIETSRNFYENICSTHFWEDRYETCENVNYVDMLLCCGGLFGLGESELDRQEYLKALQNLKPFSSPINFYIPHPKLPLQQEIISENEALEIIKNVKNALPNTRLMAAGGREQVFKTKQKEMFEAGIDAVVLGDYLTAKGENPSKDIKFFKSLGLGIQTSCHE